MISGNDETEGGDLDALFPGLTRKAAPRPSLVDGTVRAVDLPDPAVSLQPVHRRPLDRSHPPRLPSATDLAARELGAFWADPRRMFWTPVLAGAAVRLWELEPAVFPAYISDHARLLAAATPGNMPMNDLERIAVAELALTGTVVLQALWPEERALAELGLTREATLDGRVEALQRWLARTEQPVAWVALHLPAALTFGVAPIDRLLRAGRPYRELGEAFAALAERQGVVSWEEALLGTMAYWRDPRGSAILEAMVRPSGLAEAHRKTREASGRQRQVPAPAPNRPQLRKLEAKLAQAKEEVARSRAGAESWRARVSAGEREIAEVRESRDRAVARLRRVVAENARLRTAVDAFPARSEPAPAAAPVRSEPSQPTVAPAALLPLDRVFAGRSVYLYTGIERAGAREAMANVLERHGASCAVFDGNRLTLLGPERFPAEALVIIETSHLCHNASNVIEARARASGAWVYMGATGSGGLARRVAARWWRTHPGEDQRVPA